MAETYPPTWSPASATARLQMIIFEELVYQEAQKRKMTIPPERLSKAEAEFRKQFNSPSEYQQYMQSEFGETSSYCARRSGARC